MKASKMRKESGEVDVLGVCRKVTNGVNALLARAGASSAGETLIPPTSLSQTEDYTQWPTRTVQSFYGPIQQQGAVENS